MGSIDKRTDFNVAIIGGGLCGIALGNALKLRKIAFTIYEAKSSFTEIGAGINLGPNGIRSLRAIDPSLGEKVFQLATRQPTSEGDNWMRFWHGADCGQRKEGDSIYTLVAHGAGATTMHRQELLAELAKDLGAGHAKFDKKFVGFVQDDDGVNIMFGDGTQERASIVIGCDGIHSGVRRAMFGQDNPVSSAHFVENGAYRAVIPIEQALEAMGESARVTRCALGPNGYLITYPVNSGRTVNCGLWVKKKGQWPHKEWLLPNQENQFQQDLEGWGETVHKLAKYFDQNPAFWAQHAHTQQPDSFFEGRVILIGDGAHAMPPHNGAGASVAAEDAYVLSQVLISLVEGGSAPTSASIEAAFKAFEEVRLRRSDWIRRSSIETFDKWRTVHMNQIEGAEREKFIQGMHERFGKIWNVDIEADAQSARSRIEEFHDGKT